MSELAIALNKILSPLGPYGRYGSSYSKEPLPPLDTLFPQSILDTVLPFDSPDLPEVFAILNGISTILSPAIEYLRPLFVMITSALLEAISKNAYTPLVDAIDPSREYTSWPQGLSPIPPGYTDFLEATARGVTTRSHLESVLSCKNFTFQAAIARSAPALGDPSTLTWYIALTPPGYSSKRRCSPLTLALFIENQHIASQGRLVLRDYILEMMFTNHFISGAEEDFIRQSALEAPLPPHYRTRALWAALRNETFSGCYARVLNLCNDEEIVQAHLTNYRARPSPDELINLLPDLPLYAWREIVVDLAARRTDAAGDHLALFIAAGRPGHLSDILDTVLENIAPRFMPILAPLVTASDWEEIVAYYKRRRSASGLNSLLEFIEAAPLATRALLPRRLLVAALKNADPALRARAFGFISTMGPSTPTISR